MTPVEEAKKAEHHEVLELLLCTGYPTPPKRVKGNSTVQTHGMTALSVTWLTPNGHGSVIQRYEVQYRLDRSDMQDYLEEYHVDRSGDPEEEELPWVSDYAQSTSKCLNNLIPGQQYQVRVRAANILGWGKWSEILQQRTQLVKSSYTKTIAW